MDAPRRWQVASIATAVASLGLGAAMLARPTVEAVPSIDLDQVATDQDAPPIRPERFSQVEADPGGPLIVPPRSLGPTPSPSASPVSAAPASPSPASAVSDPSVDSPSPPGSISSFSPASVDSPS
jgi:hypothetical protein